MDHLITEANKQSKFGKTMFGLLTMYLSVASYARFEEALASEFGPAVGIIIGTILLASYQIIKMDKKNMSDGSYITNPYTQIIKDDTGAYQIVETNQEQQRSGAFGLFITVIFIVWACESTWSNLL